MTSFTERFQPRDTINLESMQLAQKLVQKLEPFYCHQERQKMTDVFYEAIEEDMRALAQRLGRGR